MNASSEGVGLDLLNLSMSGASLEDILAIGQLGFERLNPSYVFIGADPWLFNQNSGLSRWIYLAAWYSRTLEILGLQNSATITASYSRTVVDSIGQNLYRLINISPIVAEDESPSTRDKIRPDGSRIYNLATFNRPLSEVERLALTSVSYAMSDYKFSLEGKKILEKFIISLTRKGITVVLVLSPYHPRFYNFVSRNDRNFLDAESTFREFALLKGVHVIGSYDPARVGCASADFYDGVHPKEVCINKIFSGLHR